MEFRWFLIPILGAFIGWATNVMAIRLLFRPHRPVKILFWRLQGLIPKRRVELASNVAKAVDEELLPLSELISRLWTPELERQLTAMIIGVARQRLLERLPSFIPQALREVLQQSLEDNLRREIPPALQELKGQLAAGVPFSIGQIIAEKMNSLDLKEAEAIILAVASRELRYIEYLGGVIGFVIGLVQLAAVFCY
ncbi:MAG: DUF445 family protein [Clostridia bacterium]|nr:DUF445 family protein [Clostridia bacterium]